ncbi:hypothetical protein A3Q56_06858 [Intoshia linei]|uniref:E3 ubiquitin-protein ligase RING2 n=1 Tax=Intoshia linei TaxID=1819745 RepID=A0A177AVK6_9BILA|nr:hypothetical protein A3Q56_06858 [Intoshia linei]
MGLEDWVLTKYEKQRSPLIETMENNNIVKISKNISEIMCPICLGVLRDTMTTKECLHRFCNGCIITALRNGNKACPTCKKKLISKRSLRSDPNFDAIISIISQSKSNVKDDDIKSVENIDEIYKDNYAEANRKSHSKLFDKQLLNKKHKKLKFHSEYEYNVPLVQISIISTVPMNQSFRSLISNLKCRLSKKLLFWFFNKTEILFYPFYNNHFFIHQTEKDSRMNSINENQLYTNKMAHVRMVLGHMQYFLLIRQTLEAKYSNNLTVEIFTSMGRRKLLNALIEKSNE